MTAEAVAARFAAVAEGDPVLALRFLRAAQPLIERIALLRAQLYEERRKNEATRLVLVRYLQRVAEAEGLDVRRVVSQAQEEINGLRGDIVI